MRLSRKEVIEKLVNEVGDYDLSTWEAIVFQYQRMIINSFRNKELKEESLQAGHIKKEDIIFSEEIGWDMRQGNGIFEIYKDGVLLVQVFGGEYMAKDIFECFKQGFIFSQDENFHL